MSRCEWGDFFSKWREDHRAGRTSAHNATTIFIETYQLQQGLGEVREMRSAHHSKYTTDATVDRLSRCINHRAKIGDDGKQS